MTFSKWKSYRYKPLEPRNKRRNTIGAIRRLSRRPQSCASLAWTSPDLDVYQPGSTIAAASASIGTSTDKHAPAQSGANNTEQGPPLIRRRTRSFSVPEWTASLSNRLSFRRRPAYCKLSSSVSPSQIEEDHGPKTAPASEGELEVLLQDAWSSAFTVGEVNTTGFIRKKRAREYSRKMTELERQYDLKMAEILQREATFVRELLSHDEATPLLHAHELTIPVELKKVVHEAQSSGRFNKLRLELKKETVAAAQALKSQHSTVLSPRKPCREKPHRQSSCQCPSSALVYCNPYRDEEAQSGKGRGHMWFHETPQCVVQDILVQMAADPLPCSIVIWAYNWHSITAFQQRSHVHSFTSPTS